MTRSDDTFIPLEERTAIANEKSADLFISIHANASPDDSARGIETYYLNFTSSPDALEVAARENASSQEAVHQLQDLIKKIAMTEKIEESQDFASQVQREVYTHVTKASGAQRDRGIKKAPFVVLIGANMPSVLAEISFLTNPKDEHLLRRSEYREKIAEALYEGITDYLKTLGEVKTGQRVAVGAACRGPPNEFRDCERDGMQIRRNTPGWRSVVALLPLSCFAQNKPVITPTVPAADWRLVNSQVLPLSAVGRFGGDTAVEKEYGVKTLELRTYQLEKEQAQVLVEAAPDATAAYGLLTFYQTPRDDPGKGHPVGGWRCQSSLMARGGNFIRFLRSAGSPLSDARLSTRC